MTAKQLLSLNAGAKFTYAGQTVTLADWQCLPEPQFNAANERIDAEPLIRWPNGRTTLLTWPFWPMAQLKPCPHCRGTGYIDTMHPDGSVDSIECPPCHQD